MYYNKRTGVIESEEDGSAYCVDEGVFMFAPMSKDGSYDFEYGGVVEVYGETIEQEIRCRGIEAFLRTRES